MNEQYSALEKRLLQRASYWKKGCRKHISVPEVLTEQEKTEILDFWGKYQELFPIDTAFHSYYKEKTGNYDIRYMPWDMHFCYVDPFYNDWGKAPVVDNKCSYGRLFKDTKQPEAVLYRINNIWVDADYRLISREQMRKAVEGKGELVIKQANDSEGGSNIFFISGENMMEQLDSACKSIKKDIIVQCAICQHDVMNYVNPSSVNTIRVISLLSQDGVKVYSAILRMGVKDFRVDNISKGGIACGIDSDGRLRSPAYNYKGQAFYTHPTTGVKFDEVVLPNFDKVCDLVRGAHPSIPHFRLVSWDVSVDAQGEPLLVEANLCYGELNLHQLTNGPLFGEDTEKILKEVFEKRG